MVGEEPVPGAMVGRARSGGASGTAPSRAASARLPSLAGGRVGLRLVAHAASRMAVGRIAVSSIRTPTRWLAIPIP